MDEIVITGAAITAHVIAEPTIRIIKHLIDEYKHNQYLPKDKDLLNLKIKYVDPMTRSITVDPATPEDIKRIADLERKAYSKEDAVPYSILSHWYSANPSGFFVIKSNQHLIGHIDILPLKPKLLQKFIRGKGINEKDIRGEDLYTTRYRNKIKDLYVESVIITGNRATKAASLLKLLSQESMEHMLANICPLDNVERIHAIAASTAGDNIMKRLGFTVTTDACCRDDKHNMYSIKMKDLININRSGFLFQLLSNEKKEDSP